MYQFRRTLTCGLLAASVAFGALGGGAVQADPPAETTVALQAPPAALDTGNTVTDGTNATGGGAVDVEPTSGPVEVLVRVAGKDVIPRVVNGFRDLGSAVVISRFTHTWTGFSGVMDARDVAELRARPGVTEVVVNPGTVQLAGVDSVPVTGPYWSVDHLDQRSLPSDGVFRRPSHAGAGVDVYVIDNGIMGAHQDFANPDGSSRVVYGNTHTKKKVTAKGPCLDHGTPIASIIGGNNGIAPGVRLISYQVGCGGLLSLSGVLEAFEDIARKVRKDQRPTVINLSFNYPRATPKPKVHDILSYAVEQLAMRNIMVVTAAGNEAGLSSCNNSPGFAGTAIIVGGVGKSNDYWPHQSTPECTDVFAPAVDVLAAKIGPTGAGYDLFTGTSYATSHVAGVVALLLADNPYATFTEVKEYLIRAATRGAIKTPSPLVSLSPDKNRLLHYSVRDGDNPVVDVMSRTKDRAVLWIENFDPQTTYETFFRLAGSTSYTDPTTTNLTDGYVSGQSEEHIEIAITNDTRSPVEVIVVASQLGVTQGATEVSIPRRTISTASISDTIPVNGGFDVFATSSDPDVQWSYVTSPGVTVTPGRFGRISVRGMQQGATDVVYIDMKKNGKLIETVPVVGSSAPFDIPSWYFTSPPTDTTRVLVEVHGVPGAASTLDQISTAVTSIGGTVEQTFEIAHVGVVAWVPWSRLLDLENFPAVAAVIPVDTGTTCGAVEGQQCPTSSADFDANPLPRDTGKRKHTDASGVSPLVDADSRVTTVAVPQVVQRSAPPALDILDLSQSGIWARDSKFTYPESAGRDTYIYVLDGWPLEGRKGVEDTIGKNELVDRIEFTKRSQSNLDAYISQWCPTEKHGPLVASAAASEKNGVAKKARIIAVNHRYCGVSRLWGITSVEEILEDWNSRTLNSPEAVGVVNMSWGQSFNASWLWTLPDWIGHPVENWLTDGSHQRSGDALHERGLLSVSAAGNDGVAEEECILWPQSDPHGITVGAGGPSGIEPYSNRGSCVDIFAPGGFVYDKPYIGTSYSAPYVAGWAAILMTAFPGFPVQAYKDAILANSVRRISSKSPRPFLTTGIMTYTGGIATQVSRPVATGNDPPECALAMGCAWVQLGDTGAQQTTKTTPVRYDLTWDDGHRTRTETYWATTNTGVTVPVWGTAPVNCTPNDTCTQSIDVKVQRTQVGVHPSVQALTVELDSGDHLRQLSPQRLAFGAAVPTIDGWEFPILGNFVPATLTVAVSQGQAAIVTRTAATPGAPTTFLTVKGVAPTQDLALTVTGKNALNLPVFHAEYFDASEQRFSTDVPIMGVQDIMGDADSITWDLPAPSDGARYVTFGSNPTNRARITVSYDTNTPTYQVHLSGMRGSFDGIAMVAELLNNRVSAIHVLTGRTRADTTTANKMEILKPTGRDGGFQARISGVDEPQSVWRATSSHGTATVTNVGGQLLVDVTGLSPRQVALTHVVGHLSSGEIVTDWVLGRAGQ